MEPRIGALALTIIDMTIVFAVLFGLALVIRLTKWVLAQGQRGREDGAVVMTEPKEAPAAAGPVAADGVGVTPAVLSAITAALAAYLGDGPADLRLSSLRRLEPAESWSAAGRLENTAGRSHLQMRRFS